MMRIEERIHVDGVVRIMSVDERLMRDSATNKPVMNKARCEC